MATNNAINNQIAEYFSTYLSSNQSNVTGDGTLFDINFDTIKSNPSGTYSSGTYHAPTTGIYYFNTNIVFSTTDSTTTYDFLVIFDGDPVSVRAIQTPWKNDTSNVLLCSASTIVQMSSGNVMKIGVIASNGTKDVSILGANPYAGVGTYALASSFNGFRIA